MPSSNIADKARMIPPGVYCPVVSIYKTTPRQEIDLDASYKYFSYLIRGGVDGLVLQGSTAEAALLAPDERIQITKVARTAALDLGLNSYPIVAGVSGQSTNESIRLVDDAADAGADFGLLLPPSYWPKAVTDQIIAEFYREVADNARIPIVIYNFPGVTGGIDLSSDLIASLATHPNIVGTKLTCANPGKVTRLTSLFAPAQFSVFAGQSDWLLPCLIGRGVGCVTGMGNAFPKSISHLYSLWKDGKIEEAKEFQGLIANAEAACKKGLAGTKFAAGYFAGPPAGLTDLEAFAPRKPYKAGGKDLQEWVKQTMEHLVEVENGLKEKYSAPS